MLAVCDRSISNLTVRTYRGLRPKTSGLTFICEVLDPLLTLWNQGVGDNGGAYYPARPEERPGALNPRPSSRLPRGAVATLHGSYAVATLKRQVSRVTRPCGSRATILTVWTPEERSLAGT